MARATVRTMPVFKGTAVYTAAAGEVLHAGLARARAYARDAVSAMHFGSAAAALKCTRFGGSAGAPTRREVDALVSRQS
jgi:sulfofructose kinase